MLPRLSDGVKHLIIINALVFFGAMTLNGFGISAQTLALHHPGSPDFRIWQFITHFFMHGSFNHLMFNMLSLYFLGGMVETYLGTKRFIKFYMITGLMASLINIFVYFISENYMGGSLGFYAPVIGASGAVYGVLIAFASLFPDARLMLLFPPIPIKARYLAIGIILIDVFSGFSGYRTGIAHFAHLGGALVGFILIRMHRRGKIDSWF